MKPGFVYIMTNENNTVLYTGVTSNLPKRIQQHKEKFFELSFTAKYNVCKLVYWQSFQEIGDAIFKEKQIKAGSRQEKINLINSINSKWRDLAEDIKDIMNPF